MKDIEKTEFSSDRVPVHGSPALGIKRRLSSVLIVDDNEQMRYNLESYVCDPLYCRAFAFETSEQALELASHLDFDVVISDLCRPGMDGLEFLQLFKKAHPRTPVVILSGHACGETEKRAYELGAFICLEKPQWFTTILNELNKALEYREALISPAGNECLTRLAFPHPE